MYSWDRACPPSQHTQLGPIDDSCDHGDEIVWASDRIKRLGAEDVTAEHFVKRQPATIGGKPGVDDVRVVVLDVVVQKDVQPCCPSFSSFPGFLRLQSQQQQLARVITLPVGIPPLPVVPHRKRPRRLSRKRLIERVRNREKTTVEDQWQFPGQRGWVVYGQLAGVELPPAGAGPGLSTASSEAGPFRKKAKPNGRIAKLGSSRVPGNIKCLPATNASSSLATYAAQQPAQ